MPHTIPIHSELEITELNNCLTIDYPHPYRFLGEYHHFWEMIYVMENSFLASGDERVYTLKKGDLIFHKSMEFHRIWSVEGQNVHAFIVGFCARGTLLAPLENGAFVLSPAQQLQIEELISFVKQTLPATLTYGVNDYLQAFTSQAHGDPGPLQIFISKLQLFLICLSISSTPLNIKELSSAGDIQLYQKIVCLLKQHTRDWITIEQIADQLQESTSKIKRTFCRHSEVGIHKYLLKLKIAEAVRLLHAGCSCLEVSQRLGFDNQNYFSTVFKREIGCSPSQYWRTN